MASGGERPTRDRCRVLQRAARDLRRIDDACLHPIRVFTGGDIVTFVALARLDFLNNERAFLARVVRELTGRLFDGPAHDLHAHLLVTFKALDVIERFLRANERLARIDVALAHVERFFGLGRRPAFAARGLLMAAAAVAATEPIEPTVDSS